MQGNAEGVPRFLVSAPRAEVEAVLRSVLTPEQFQNLTITQSAPPANPLLRRRGFEEETVVAIAKFVIEALAGSMLTQLMKEVGDALASKLGKERVKKEEPNE